MSRRKRNQPLPDGPPKTSDWFARAIGVLTLCLGLYNACTIRQTRLLDLPAITAKVDLRKELVAGQPIFADVTLENLGKSIAKNFKPQFRWRIRDTFQPDYSSPDSMGLAEPQGVMADLNPGGKATLENTSSITLMHPHDVEAILSGQQTLYLFGRATYDDVWGGHHEVHFCRFYRPAPESSYPLKWNLCPTYNETVN